MRSNARLEAASSVATPSATAAVWTRQPAAMPKAAATPARTPCAAARPITNSRSGPGVMFNSSPAAMNSGRLVMPSAAARSIMQAWA
jgi:hypothetical protein